MKLIRNNRGKYKKLKNFKWWNMIFYWKIKIKRFLDYINWYNKIDFNKKFFKNKHKILFNDYYCKINDFNEICNKKIYNDNNDKLVLISIKTLIIRINGLMDIKLEI